MAVTRLEILARRPYEGGRRFGDAGGYERIDGLVHFAVDPADPANRAIVDLDRAERGPDGRVHFRADVCLLQPLAPVGGRLLVDVPNRGRKVAVRMFNRAANEAVPTERIDPGDGFLFRHGWSVAWTGWQWDVIRGPALMGLEAPSALENGRPIAGQTICEFQPGEPSRDHLLADRVHQPYPAADLDDPEARLLVRAAMDAPAAEVPRGRWRFARDQAGQPVPDPTRVWLEDGFQPGRFYTVVYRTARCPVVGTGLLALRDWAAFLRFNREGNPAAGRVDRSIAFGVSQSGRFLRHFLYLGLNRDEAGRTVFDGVMPHVAGGRRGEFNHRFAQPSVQATRGFGHLPPFADEGLLARQREVGGLPRIVATNTSAEYWRGDCSLVHVDPDARRDLAPTAEARLYLFAGTQHGPGGLPLTDTNPNDGARGAHGFNAVDYAPLLRAALLNLDRWVAEGVEPPPSQHPRLADGTAWTAAEVLSRFRVIPGATVPEPGLAPTPRRIDLGPAAGQGVGRYPVAVGQPYQSYVPAVDADLNEVGGVRLPDLTVPVATYTGWNPRHPDTGGPGQIVNMQGSTLPLPATADERARRGDPRPAIAERYRDREDYRARVRAEAERLAAERYLLPEDVDLVVDGCLARYDAFAAAAVRA